MTLMTKKIITENESRICEHSSKMSNHNTLKKALKININKYEIQPDNFRHKRLENKLFIHKAEGHTNKNVNSKVVFTSRVHW